MLTKSFTTAVFALVALATVLAKTSTTAVFANVGHATVLTLRHKLLHCFLQCFIASSIAFGSEIVPYIALLGISDSQHGTIV